jgi:hypothetical protein
MWLFRRKKAQADQVIDLRSPATAAWGSPVPCPSCLGRGYLDHIDPYREVMYLHCTSCDLRYEVARAEFAGQEPSEAVPS